MLFRRREADPNFIPRSILALMVGFVAVMLGGAAVYKYQTLQSDWAFDLAFFHTLIFNAAQGEGFHQTASLHELDGLRYLSHAFYILLAYVLPYKAFPHIETLFFCQALFLASGAWPTAQICRAAGGSWPIALLAALAYLLSFPLWRLGLADIRPLALGAPALLWLGMTLVRRRPLHVAIAALLACTCREELAIMVIALSAGMWLGRRTDRRSALLAINLGLAYFVLLLGHRPRMDYYVPFSKPGVIFESLRFALPEGVPWDRPLSHLKSYALLPFLGAFLEPLVLLGGVPVLVYLFMVSPYEWWQWEGAYVHHAGPLLGVVAVAGALGLGRIEAFLADRGAGDWGMAARGFLGLLLVLGLAREGWLSHEGVMADLGFRGGQQEEVERARQLEALWPLINSVSPGEGVVTDFRLMAVLSGREALYCYQGPFGPGSGERGLGRQIPTLKDVDVALVFAGHQEFVEAVEAEGAFAREGQGGGYVLYRRR